MHGRPLVYLDNAATTQKPRVVLQALIDYYTGSNANVHRGVHYLSGKATDLFEAARGRIATFIGAADPKEIIFTRNATEGINLVAQTWGRTHVKAGDEVLISGMEHHSNIVPWQLLCTEKGATLRVVPILDSGELDMEAFARLLTPRTRIVAISAAVECAGHSEPDRGDHPRRARGRRRGPDRRRPGGVPHARERRRARLRLLRHDRAQALRPDRHRRPLRQGRAARRDAAVAGRRRHDRLGDLRALDLERAALQVRGRHARTSPAPSRLGVAVDYITAVGMDRIQAHEQELLAYGTAALLEVPGVTLVGTAPRKASILSFVMEGVHPHDLGTIVDREGVAIRTGHHCAQPVMDRFGIPATARASLAMYNTREDIDALVAALHTAKKVFG